MDLAKIQELLKIVAESGVAEVEIEEDDFKLTIRQNSPTVMMQPSAPSYGMPYAPSYGMPQQPPPPSGGYPTPGSAPQQPQQSASVSASQPPASPSNNASASAAAEAASENATAGGDTEEEAAGANEHVVKAELVGTFYRAPAPDSDPFVEEGDTISEGDVLCIIEAMKIMNEIECETSGVIKKILVEDAEPVEFDQPLFIIETG